MLPDESPPEHLEDFRRFAEERGQKVRREYFWGGEYTDEDGELQYAEPGWETLLVREEKQADDRFVMHMLYVEDRDLSPGGWEQKWALMIDLNEMGFQQTLEKEGYAVP